MDRLTELKEKAKQLGGYFSLSKEEQKEYTELKGKQDEQNAPVKKATDSEVEELKKEIERLKAAQKLESGKKTFESGDWKQEQESVQGNKKAKMRLYREDSDEEYRMVIDWWHHKDILNEVTGHVKQVIYKIKLVDSAGKEEVKEVDWAQFMKRSDYEEVEIVDSQVEKLVRSHGKAVRPRVGRDGYTYSRGLGGTDNDRTMTSNAFEMLERKDNITVTIQRESGQKLTLNANKLNG